MAGLAGAADGRLRPRVPALEPFGLPDQLVVLLADAQQAGVTAAALEAVLDRLVVALGLRLR